LSLTLDNDAVNAPRSRLRSTRLLSDKQQRLFLRADKTVPYGELMTLMNELAAQAICMSRWSAWKPTSHDNWPRRIFPLGRMFCTGALLSWRRRRGAGGQMERSLGPRGECPLIMIDLAPVAAAPETVPNDLPPDQCEPAENRSQSRKSRLKRSNCLRRKRKHRTSRCRHHRKKSKSR